MVVKKCQECQDPFKGRSDKKFCSDQCRNTYNNKQKTVDDKYVRNVNNVLKKNRNILAKSIKDSFKKTHRDELLLSGYNFNFHTNTFVNRKGGVYYFCYDMGFLQLEKETVIIVKRNSTIPV